MNLSKYTKRELATKVKKKLLSICGGDKNLRDAVRSTNYMKYSRDRLERVLTGTKKK